MATSWLANEAWAQDGVLKFEVASVQRSLGDGRRSMALKPSGLSYSNVTLTDSLAAAYRIERYRVAGPDWLSRERYVIEAKASGAVEPSEIMQMLQSLLGERFGVKIHWERRELPIYLLRVLKGGPTGLKLVDTRSGVVPISGGMTFQGITMPEFVDQFLSGLPFMDRAVVDGTGLTGRYEFSLRIFPQDIPAGDLKAAVSAGGQDLFIDALEQIGLQLAREKRLVDVLVVDHAEAEPTDN
jgi:uncharacterized protein (TIGR03435 family)